MKHLYTRSLEYDIVEAVDEARVVLNTGGFHVVQELDAQAVIAELVGIDCQLCVIYTVYHDKHSHEITQGDCAISLLASHRVAVYRHMGQVYIAVLLVSYLFDYPAETKRARAAKELEEELVALLQTV